MILNKYCKGYSDKWSYRFIAKIKGIYVDYLKF